MYIDVNGKIGYRELVGTSGNTYGNMKLLTTEEKAAAFTDGIQDYVPPAPTPDSPEVIERRRKQRIIGYAMSRINEDLLGDSEDGEDQLMFTLLKMMSAIRGTAESLIAKGVMAPADFNNSIKNLADQVDLYQQVRQAAKDAITNDDTPETAEAAVDAIIPPTVT